MKRSRLTGKMFLSGRMLQIYTVSCFDCDARMTVAGVDEDDASQFAIRNEGWGLKDDPSRTRDSESIPVVWMCRACLKDHLTRETEKEQQASKEESPATQQRRWFDWFYRRHQ